MLTNIQFALYKLRANVLIDETIERLGTSFPHIQFVSKDVISDRVVDNHRYYITFTNYGDKIHVREVHFSTIGYVEDSLKKTISVDVLMESDINEIMRFIEEPNIVGTSIPQFEFFTYLG